MFTKDAPEEPSERHLLTMDPPDHGRYRNIISKWFTPRTVKVWEPKVQRVTREVLDKAAAKGEIDFVADVSAPITIAVIALMLGVPEEDWHLLFRWTNEIIASEDPEYQQGRTQVETNEQAQGELFAYFKQLSDKRRSDPKDDILSAVVRGQIDGAPLNDLELLSYYFLLVVAQFLVQREHLGVVGKEPVHHGMQLHALDPRLPQAANLAGHVFHVGVDRAEGHQHVVLDADQPVVGRLQVL